MIPIIIRSGLNWVMLMFTRRRSIRLLNSISILSIIPQMLMHARIALGDVYLKTKKYNEAIKYYKEVIKSQPQVCRGIR